MPFPTQIFPMQVPDPGNPASPGRGIRGFLERLWPHRPGAGASDPDPRDLLLRRIRALELRVNDAALRTEELAKLREPIERDLRDLEGRNERFARHRGRRLALAFSSAFIPALSWAVDAMITAPLIEAITTWTGIPAGLPARVAGSGLFCLLGYFIGAKLGAAREDRQSSLFLWVAAAAYIAALTTVAFTLAREAGLPEPVPEAVGLLGLFGSVLPIAAGSQTADSWDYLLYLWRRRRLQRALDRIDSQRLRTGRAAVSLWMRLRQAIDEYRRRFGEEVQPRVAAVTAQVIERFSEGRYEIRLQAEGPAVEAPDQAVPTADAAGHPADGEGLEAETEYLREIIEQQNQRRDEQLAP